MDILGMFRGLERRLGSTAGHARRRDQAQEQGLAVRLGEPERHLRGAEAHLLEGARHQQVHQPEPGRLGPFVRVSRFNAQDYVLERNPLLEEGQAEDQLLEYIQATSNDAALLQIVSGKADWTHNFVPNVEKAYIAKKPRYYHAFYDVTAYPIAHMLPGSTRSLIPFRKAVSMAIDRNKVSKLGEYGYAPPTDAIGLSQLFPSG